MPRIFDNIEQSLLPALKDMLQISYRADSCVGYFNLHGWKMIDTLIDEWAGGLDSCCRLPVWMRPAPQDELRAAFSFNSEDHGIDQQTVKRLQRRAAEGFREQLAFGAPTNADGVSLRRLSEQIKARKVIVKLFLRRHLHAKLLHRADPNNPSIAFSGSSNLTLAGLSKQGELNIDALEHDACDKLQKWFNDRWDDRWCLDIPDEIVEIIDTSWALPKLVPPYYIYLKIAYHPSQEARAGLSEFRIPRDFGNRLFEFQNAAVKIAAHHLKKRGGVLIGDVAGLGENLMATALARLVAEDWPCASTLIICPKNLVKMWRAYVDEYGLRPRVLSLSRVTRELRDIPARFRTVLIGESHNLRNREGKRYRAIQEYIRLSDSRCILPSATPYNKAYEDLSSRLRLFIPEDQDLGIRPEKKIREGVFQSRFQYAARTLTAFEKSSSRVRGHLNDFNFSELFIEELGWSRPTERHKTTLEINGESFERLAIAELSGVVVYEVTPTDGVIPEAKMRRAIHVEVSKLHYENLLIFLDRERTQSLWYWAKREGKKTYPRDHAFMRGQPANLFLQKLSGMVVDISELDEEGNIAVTQVASKLKGALDVERVTKKFYNEFRQEHLTFIEHITGIEEEHDRRWYASVLLHRLMFIYFLQSKGFIKGHEARQAFRYLQDELKRSRGRGKDRYYSEFLDALFSEGFAKPEGDRSAEVRKLVGAVPYLNGGLFIKHGIEERWPKIVVPDVAFENLFRLFESYSWNLDDTPGGQADEINPDVLGYIFEKYINQKAFGAYYTRTEVTQYLCEQTIHKLILDRINAYAQPPPSAPRTGEPLAVKDHKLFASRRFDSMAELLLNLDSFYCQKLLQDILPDLKLLDPACGSGAFLVEAMKTLMNIYAAVIGRMEFLGDAGLKQWLGKLRQEHPSINYYIKKRIITDNLFGVDIMEEATEIAKLRLFLALVASVERAEQLESLPNIDFNILTGHSLIGLLRVNDEQSDRRHAHGNLFQKAYRDFVRETTNEIRVYRRASSDDQGLRAMRADMEERKREVMATLDELLLDQLRDLGIKFEQATWDERKNKAGRPIRRRLMIEDIRALRPFHWGFEFDDIINRSGGFDAIITNPPWAIFKPQAKEFFSEHSGLVTKNRMTIKDFEKEQARLLKDKEVREAWLDYQSRFPHLSLYFRNAPQYKNQISIVNGRKAGTDINLYKLFLEQCFNLLKEDGECGIVIPSGIYTDLGTKQLREMLFGETEITGLFGFENRKFIFEGVDMRFKFVVLTFRKGGRTERFPAAFMRHNVTELEPFPKNGALRVSVNLINRLSPDTLSVMEFKNETDVRITEKMLRFPLLGERIRGQWNLVLTNEFHMTNDSHLFETEPAAGRWPLYEGKMIQQFIHNFHEPRYWVDDKKGRKALLGREKDTGQKLDYQEYRLGFRDIAANTNERTLISTIIPPAFHGNKLPTAAVFNSTGDRILTEDQQLFLCAIWNSFVIDSMLRMKVTTTLNFFYIYSLPVPRLTKEDRKFAPIVERAAKLICTTPEFDDLAREAGLKDHTEGATDEQERAQLRAELDGMIAHLYHLTEDEFAYVLSTFPLVSEEVKASALDQFRRFAPTPDKHAGRKHQDRRN